MNAMSWRAISYRIPFRQPVRTAHGTLRSRRGWWLVVTDEEGWSGLGEVAPLPGFRTETYEEAEKGIESLLRRDHSLVKTGIALPALTAGVQVALADLGSKKLGRRLAERWADCPRERVACHYLLRETAPQDLAGEAANAVAQGYRTLKIKVGANRIDEEQRRLAAVRERVGEKIHLRADANGAYDPATVLDLLRRFERYRLEFIEQPIRESLESLRGKTGVPIAADESIGSTEDAQMLITKRAVDVLILKPMLIGGVDVAMQIADRAAQVGIRVVITTALESPVGVAAALHVAAALPIEATCGLATVDHLEATPIYGLQRPFGGSLRLPTGPGLGVQIDPNLLEEGRG